MAHDLTSVIVLGALAFGASRLLARRRKPAPEPAIHRSAARPTPVAARRVRKTDRSSWTASASPDESPPVNEPGAYLLGGRPADGRRDSNAALLDMMSGPGLCTPRTTD